MTPFERTPSAQTTRSLLRRQAVEQRTGLGKSSIYALIAKGQFPAGVKLHGRAVAWPSDQIDGWIQSRITASAV